MEVLYAQPYLAIAIWLITGITVAIVHYRAAIFFQND